ncbi:uncharacterized protein ACLA_052450 [Aspergillus clavatus NRRL 1]|uniref:Uncharacterized protein n=1 Tax=Aspergillus clavatus (strain ATCC 1007 / CBS 513.65 / DSM 816 / NCTC 3887 / NRRL 1 / QM 1276 / 107) TaxID=344612 RepID=A1CIR7_ASPCL|nr:uncharacterized protein ACLA_052450 [Aspergillus clavatus NRRL 1]EAW10772.1 conserved hypothetical protein [Aspergillus clavatus NRRL 1]
MDSMRSLNTSLPSSTPRPQPPEQLLQSFKAAALSVTNLYKNAVLEQAQARQAGYQEAIEDLLHFLDKENLGLGDGEGWRVRQWATERSDGLGTPSDDDERGDSDKTRSTPHVPVRKEQTESEAPRQTSKLTSPQRDVPAAPEPQQQAPVPSNPIVSDSNTLEKPTVFTFTAGPSFPQYQEPDVDMQASDNSSASSQDSAPVSVSVLPRNSRQQNRQNNLSRSNLRTSPRDPSVGLGSKRKLPFPDFFDLSELGSKDIFGGGKRGRFT